VLEGYPWSGNVRELFNVLEQAFVASGSARTLYSMHLPQDVRIKVAKASLRRPQAADAPTDAPGAQQQESQAAPCCDTWPELTQAMNDTLKSCKDVLERRYLETLLRRTGGDVQKAMEASGLSRSHLYALLKKWGLSADGPGVGSADPVGPAGPV
jgi:two-component system NtrC family response regulator